jgi:gamma-glutamylcyclotransferase (GGCT)/AIG2-like uncharacterized protein YtfP
MDRITLFVYGTLKRGGRSNHLLVDQEFVGEAQTLPHYRLYENGSHPCLVGDAEQGLAIRGELWRVDEATLHRLDVYEGVPNLFQRQMVEVAGAVPPIWAYFYQREVAGLHDCGSFWPSPV